MKYYFILFRKSMSVTVDRTELTAIKTKYEEELELWKKKVVAIIFEHL
jgi:hypothetical protein